MISGLVGCLINYLITLSTVFKLPPTPGKVLLLAFLFGSQLLPAEASGFRGCGRANRRCYTSTFSVAEQKQRKNKRCGAASTSSQTRRTVSAAPHKHRHRASPSLVNNADYCSLFFCCCFLSKVLKRRSRFAGALRVTPKRERSREHPPLFRTSPSASAALVRALHDSRLSPSRFTQSLLCAPGCYIQQTAERKKKLPSCRAHPAFPAD